MVLYDKLKNIKTEEKKFDFICPTCGANGFKKDVFTIKPLGISWRPDNIDNSDLSDSPKKVYNSLPSLQQALLLACNKNNELVNLIIECNKCQNAISVYDKIDLPMIRKWINKNMNIGLDLRIEKDVDKNVIRKRKSRLRY